LQGDGESLRFYTGSFQRDRLGEGLAAAIVRHARVRADVRVVESFYCQRCGGNVVLVGVGLDFVLVGAPADLRCWLAGYVAFDCEVSAEKGVFFVGAYCPDQAWDFSEKK